MSFVVPFAGTAAAAGRLLDALARLDLAPGDELIVADASAFSAVATQAGANVKVVAADAGSSAAYARNEGAAVAGGEWLLFLDPDCAPPADLLDRYLRKQPPERCAVRIGGIRSSDRSRHGPHVGQLSAIAANMLLRRAVWESIGGFPEGVRRGSAAALCGWLSAAGWGVEPWPDAAVESERARPDRSLLEAWREGAGRRWLGRVLERSAHRPAGGVRSIPVRLGYLLGDNRAVRAEPRRRPPAQAGGQRLVMMTDAFPARSETFVYGELQELSALGLEVRVESSSRPSRTERAVARSARIDYLCDEPPLAKARALAWLVARHPLRAWADRRLRARLLGEEPAWPLAAIAPAARRVARSGERHIHVHFAAGAAGDALRIARLLGRTYSVVGHGYDLFQKPRNLPLKMGEADFVVATCEYTARETARLAPDADPIHVVVLGVDGERFRRRSPHHHDGTVIAVGRLVEKKGFVHLLEAAAMVPPERLRRLLIVGDGPLRAELVARARELGLSPRFELLDGWGAEPVRAALEQADLFAMPVVIAADGDRDAMPVVVKEAMAMELPVVASDEVGLPEVVTDSWGRLVPPGDPAALAAALEELLALPAAEREAMGARARRHVLAHCDGRAEVAKLHGLLRKYL